MARSRTIAPKGTDELAQGDELHTFRYTFRVYNNQTSENATWSGSFQTTWNSLFASIAPLMINESSEPSLQSALNQFVKDINYENLMKKKELKLCELSQFSINRDDFQTIKIQLRALGLIVRSEKPRSVKDIGTYWTLTPYGDTVMTRLRAIKRVIVPEEVPVAIKDDEPK